MMRNPTLEAISAVQLADLAARLLELGGGAVMTPINREDIGRLRQISEADATADELRLISRVTAWIEANRDLLVEALPGPTPPFDHLADFWINFYDGPRGSSVIEAPRAYVKPMNFLGFDLSFPFGVPACALTPQSDFVGFFARRGFDLLTYKTVRDRAWDPYPFPQWGFAINAPSHFTDPPASVTASLAPPAGLTADGVSLVNSFGVPSLPPEQWAEDVEKAKKSLAKGQVLIVSVMGSPETLAPNQDEELSRQFARTAAQAAEAGADIVEVNLSCPNAGGDLICRHPELSAAILTRVRAELGQDAPPVLMKISHLAEPALRGLVDACYELTQGVVAINAVMVPTRNADGTAFFQDRADAHGSASEWAGLSGSAILELGVETASSLVGHRERLGIADDWVVVGVGGVTTPEDYARYMNVGVDAVQSCSGAWLNPSLASIIRKRFGRRTARMTVASLLEPLATGGVSFLTDEPTPVVPRR